MTTPSPSLSPRKSPVQARASATVEAIHAATIQVLIREGLKRCTTTRIAARAGVSVGSLYQYYPNRDALFAAVLKVHLDAAANAIIDASQASHGAPVAEMARRLVRAFLAAKLKDPDASRALYAVAHESGGSALIARNSARTCKAVAAMLKTASDVHFPDPDITASIMLAALVGPVRSLLEGQTPPGLEGRLGNELETLTTSYLRASARG